jgi:hypothetical protein
MKEEEEKRLADEPPPENQRPAMDFHDRHTQFAPVRILDVDNGVDFTFKGMGLKGNREN